jgi:transmembrane sensor
MNNRLAELLSRYLNHTASDREMQEFFALVEDPSRSDELTSLLGDAFSVQQVYESISADRASLMIAGIVGDENAGRLEGRRRIYPLWKKLSVAASVLVIVSIGLYRNYRQPGTERVAPAITHAPAIGPGGEKAMLTLADGTQIELNNAGQGEIATQPGISIRKTSDGQIAYGIQRQRNSKGALPVFNTISTPVGGQYQLILPDGSKVWLNAGSSLRYPTFFAGSERLVELTGEAYFEITPDKKMPFLVKSRIQTVKVLGTHFNINAYADEPGMKTTLLEGAVQVNAQRLVPGQQALLTEKGMTVRQVDTEAEIAWKNGEFVFNGEDLQTIMRMVARWYNIEVIYESPPGDLRYGGEVSRSKNLSDILKMLEATGDVRFRVEGRRVTVIR